MSQLSGLYYPNGRYQPGLFFWTVARKHTQGLRALRDCNLMLRIREESHMTKVLAAAFAAVLAALCPSPAHAQAYGVGQHVACEPTAQNKSMNAIPADV
jgi:hypothetical protein